MCGQEKKKTRSFENWTGYLPGTLCLFPVKEDLYLNQWGTQQLSFCYVVLVGSQGFGRSWYSACGVTDVLQQEYGDTKASRRHPVP